MSKKPTLSRCRVLACVCAITVASSVDASWGQGAVVVTEEEFVAALGASHPAVVALGGQVAHAEGERRRAGLWDNPTLEYEYEAPSSASDQTTLKLGWRPPFDGRRGLAVQASEAKLESARRRLQWAQLQLRQEFRATYVAWAVATRRRALVAEHFASLDSLKRRLDVRAQRGEESTLAARRLGLAVSEVRGALARAEVDLAKARGDVYAAREDLPAEASPVLPELPPVPPMARETERPDVLALRHDVEAAQLRRRVAGRIIEFPTLAFGWTRVSEADETFEGPFIGASWDLPFFDRNQGDRVELTDETRVRRAQLATLEIRANQRWKSAHASYVALRASVLDVADVVDDAPAVAAAARASFLAGESSMTDLLETLRSVLDSQLAALELSAQALAAHRELELSMGRTLTQGDTR